MANANVSKVSLEKKSLPSGKGTETQYASAKVLGKASSSNESPAKYDLKNKKC